MAANEHPAWYATASEFASERTSGWTVTSGPVEQPAVVNEQSTGTHSDEAGILRQVMESLACLAVAVIVFRAFLLEGYIISTGSMAPSLLGYHKQVVCPDCKYEFAYGVAFDRPSMAPSQLATCPNCGQGAIDLSKVPRNDGDQLLVNKYAYLFDDPNRWEVVVFLNPNNPNQAYVKRVVGLPGETVYVRDGDVYIDGKIQRKTMAEQRAIRIPVFDQKFQASGENWIPRWLTDPEWLSERESFAFNKVSSGESHELRNLSWVRYFHWPRLSPDLMQAEALSLETLHPTVISDNYGYNQPVRSTEQYRVNDLMLSAQLDFSDRNAGGGNVATSDPNQFDSPDHLSLPNGEFVARLSCRKKQIVCRIDAETKLLELWIVGSSAGEADRVLTDGQPADASVQLKDDWFKGLVEFELSSFDRQASVGINGVALAAVPLDDELREVPDGTWSESPQGDLSRITVAGSSSDSTLQAAERSASASDSLAGKSDVQQAAWTNGVTSERAGFSEGLNSDQTSNHDSSNESLSPVAFGARNGSVVVKSVTLYRDVHYTTENHRHATERPLKLGEDEFFFLGDNSPVSLDSRGWRKPVVPRRLLVGRPLVVHLPSQPGRIKIGSMVKYVRIPDFSKIRCIQ